MRTEICIVVALGVLTLACVAGLWLMIRRPQRWTLWVERENNFWRDKGFISSELAERLKRWEKGRALKACISLGALIGLIGMVLTITTLMRAAALQHQKLRVPYNPIFQSRPRTTNQPRAKP